MPPISQYVLNAPALPVASTLRYTDTNGDLVTQLYPREYISLIGSAVNSLNISYQQVSSLLASYNTRINTLEQEVANIQASGTTFMLYVNPACLYNDNVAHPIDQAFNLLSAGYCSYTQILGTTTAIANSISAENSNTLNTLPAYSQVSAMSGLAGWDSTPTTVADTINNLWIAYNDARVGISQALNQSNITCASVHINYQGVYNIANRTVTFYFYSSSIPTNFSGSGASSGTVLITDTAGHSYTQTFNLYTTLGVGYLVCDVSASALLQNSNYSVVLSYALTSSSPSLGCNGGIPSVIANNTSTCPNISAVGLSQTSIQFTFAPTTLANSVYEIDLINSSGTTSGTTVIATKTYTNPATSVTDTFTGLTGATRYYIRTTVIYNGNTTVCPLISQTTSS